MKKTLLKFDTLEALAQFAKKIQPRGYTINTMQLTLAAELTPFERSIAIDEYGGSLLPLTEKKPERS